MFVWFVSVPSQRAEAPPSSARCLGISKQQSFLFNGGRGLSRHLLHVGTLSHQHNESAPEQFCQSTKRERQGRGGRETIVERERERESRSGRDQSGGLPQAFSAAPSGVRMSGLVATANHAMMSQTRKMQATQRNTWDTIWSCRCSWLPIVGGGRPSPKLNVEANRPKGKAPIPNDMWKPVSPKPKDVKDPG